MKDAPYFSLDDVRKAYEETGLTPIQGQNMRWAAFNPDTLCMAAHQDPVAACPIGVLAWQKDSAAVRQLYVAAQKDYGAIFAHAVEIEKLAEILDIPNAYAKGVANGFDACGPLVPIALNKDGQLFQLGYKKGAQLLEMLREVVIHRQ